MIRAVIFDFNGILVDDEPVHFALFREVLGQEGIVLDERRYHERYLGFDDRGCFEAALADAGQEAGRDRVDDLIARKARRYAAVAEAGLRFFPGAAECLAALAGRWPLAICSGALRPEIEFALARLGLRDRVAAIVSAEDTTRCKPDPEGYRLALGALRASSGAVADLRPGECLVVEDSLAGVESAQGRRDARGGGRPHLRPRSSCAGAEAVLPDLAHLSPRWVEQHF